MPYADPVKVKEYQKEYSQRDYVKVKKREYNAEWVKKNYELSIKNSREYYNANREKVKASVRERSRKYRKEHPERVRETRRKKLKEIEAYFKEYWKAYSQRDDVKISRRERDSKRRALEMRTSKFEINNSGNILKLFKLSNKKTKETGRDYHVDHIVPLQGRLVSGFHVSGNLRVILAKTNLSKHNHYIARDESLIQRRMIKTWKANGVKFKLNKPKKGAKCTL
jgi:hypothetical protein